MDQQETEATVPAVLELEPLHVPSLYINFDVNDYLEEHDEQEMFDLLGKLKDLLG